MTEYEVVGVVDASVAADVVEPDSEAILIEHDDPSERLIAAPKDDKDA